MAASQQVVPGLFVIPTGIVNTFLIDSPDGCVLVDAGLPGRDADILRGVAAAGRCPPSDRDPRAPGPYR
jgi:glyoxylase-like metal-dependent hydrolase (beta-lactamase superfamily II)